MSANTKTEKEMILEFLKNRGGWVFGGEIEDYIANNTIHKASNASRVCRKMHEDGLIGRQLAKVGNKNVVQYCFLDRPYPATSQASQPEICCASYKVFQIHSRECPENAPRTTQSLTPKTLFG